MQQQCVRFIDIGTNLVIFLVVYVYPLVEILLAQTRAVLTKMALICSRHLKLHCLVSRLLGGRLVVTTKIRAKQISELHHLVHFDVTPRLQLNIQEHVARSM